MTPDLRPSPVPENPEDATRTMQTTAAMPGTAIGPYKLVRQLGEGGMGLVYQAQQTQPIRRSVALKIIKPGMDSKQVIARFESERQALAMMDHPNIAHVLDAGTTEAGLPYFVMELVQGVPIAGYCDSKKLSLKERIELFIPVCQAIQHAHQKGIIHRDIKPSNVLVEEREGKPAPKVIDFGLAKALGEGLGNASVYTNLGTVVGTFQYMSPEQAEIGRQDIDTRSDVYSLGAVLYELLAGTTPLEHKSLAKAGYVEILQRIREEEPKPPSARISQSTTLSDAAAQRRSDPARLPKLLQGELDWIVMKAIEKDRTRRYETVNGLARDLQRYLAGEPLEAAPPSKTYRIGKFIRQHRVWIFTAGAFTVLLLNAVGVSTWLAVRAGRAQREAVLQRNTATAVNEFLRRDLLAQASADNQAKPGSKPDPDIKVRTVLDRAAAGIEGKFGTQPVVEASIRETIGDAYLELGLDTEAQQQLERSLAIRERLLGEDHPDTLRSMGALGDAFMKGGKYADAEPLFVKTLEIRRRVSGEENALTLGAMNNLTALYYYRGNFPQAEALFRELLEIRRRVSGEENKGTLMAMNNLAGVYHVQGKFAQAEPLYARALEIRRRVNGEDHPATLQVLVNLAELYSDQGKYLQAEPLYRQALEVRIRMLGEQHRDTVYSMDTLAIMYTRQGKYGQAEALYVRAIAAASNGMGEEHPRTLESRYGLAELYRAQGKYELAEALFSKVLESRRRVLGGEHPATLDTLDSLGETRLQRKKYTEAEVALRTALSGNEKVRPGAWERYWNQSMLGASLAGQRKYSEAEPLLVSGYEGLVQRESTMSAAARTNLAEAGRRIVQLYEDWKKPEKAAEWKQKLPPAELPGSAKRP